MIFDLMAGIIERYLSDPRFPFRSLIDEARLFVFPGRAHEHLRRDWSNEECSLLRDHFFLPFRTIAVEDTASCIILRDTVKKQRGFTHFRQFCECLPLSGNNADEFSEGFQSPEEFRTSIDNLKRDLRERPGLTEMLSDAALITLGMIKAELRPEGSESDFQIEGRMNGVIGVSKSRGIIIDPQSASAYLESQGVGKDGAKPCLRNAMTAIEEVMYFNTPNRFVLESSPVRIKKPKKMKKGHGKRILRSQDRPLYTLMTPGEIRSKLRLPDAPPGSRQAPRPHERRRHLRTFRDERYTQMKGKSIIIPATWIGPSEAEVDRKRYRVMLDL